MNNLARTILTGWNLFRIIYLIIGAMLIVQAVQSHELPFAMVGSLFLYQSIFNTGCCGVSGTTFKQDSKDNLQKTLQDTDYTEIK